MTEILKVKDLRISFFTHVGEVKAIRGINFSVEKGQIVGIVGESGSGKSVTSLSVMGLLQQPGRVTGGEILFKGENLQKIKKRHGKSERKRNIHDISGSYDQHESCIYSGQTDRRSYFKPHEAEQRRIASQDYRNA